MKSKFLVFATLFLLQGQTAFAESIDSCCPPGETAVGWKCGLTVYRCPSPTNISDPIAICEQGVGGADEVVLTQAECDDLKWTEIGSPCGVGGQDLSNRICIKDGFITKADATSCGTCDTAPPNISPSESPSNIPTEIPSETPSDIPSEAPSDIPSEAPSDIPSESPTDLPTPSTCGDCTTEDAASWKCGNVVYYCEGVTIGCNQGSNGEGYTEVPLTADECLLFKSGIALDHACPVGGQGLSNYVCYDDAGYPVTKTDSEGYDCCQETEPPVPTPTSTPPPHPTLAPTPSTCGDCTTEDADSWKCGNVVYYCEGVTIGCNQGSNGEGYTEVPLTEDECLLFKSGIALDQACPVGGQGLSNFVCYDDAGVPVTKTDSEDSKCCSDETQLPVETDPPVTVDPRGPLEPERVEPETPPPTDVNRQSPEETQAPEACPDDVILVETEGSASFPAGAVEIISQDVETVTISVTQAFASENLAALFYQYYESVFSEKCYEKTEITPDSSFEITVQCTHSSQIALVEFWVVDPNLSDDNDAKIPKCCHPSELDKETPAVKHLVEIRCVSSCPGTTQ